MSSGGSCGGAGGGRFGMTPLAVGTDAVQITYSPNLGYAKKAHLEIAAVKRAHRHLRLAHARRL